MDRFFQLGGFSKFSIFLLLPDSNGVIYDKWASNDDSRAKKLAIFS